MLEFFLAIGQVSLSDIIFFVRNKSILYLSFILAFMLWALNALALMFYLYWDIGWYDYMMHFLGGLTLGVMSIWLLKVRNYSLRSFLPVFLLVMTLGLGWEIFEYVNGMTFSAQDYKVDTIHDLIMDAFGALVAYWLVRPKTEQSF